MSAVSRAVREGRPAIRPLSELRRADETAFGGKSSGLGELLSAGIRVPPGFALSCELWDGFEQEAGLVPLIRDALAGGGGKLEAVRAAARTIAAAIRSAPFPAELRLAVSEHYGQLAESTGEPAPAVAVRSSAVGEDSAEAAFAGQQQTFLWVRGAGAVCEAVRDCWASLYSAEAIAYRGHLGGPRPARMGVAVQLMVDAAVSGVLFTCNPVSGDPSMVAIDAGFGLGPAVVGGEITPDELLISKVTGEVVRESIGDKTFEYVPDVAGGGMRRLTVSPERASSPCLSAALRTALLDVARACERHFGCHVDVEWAVARTGEPPDSVYVVQSRPVTVIAKRLAPPAAGSALAMVMSRFGAAIEGGGVGRAC